MIKLLRAALALVVLTVPALSQAGAPESTPSWGRAYLSFSPDGPVRSLDVAPFEPVTFYLMIDLDIPAGESVRLVALEGALVYEPTLFLSQIDWGGGHIDIGRGVQDGVYDFEIGYLGGEDRELVDGPNAIGRFTGVLLEEDQLMIAIEPEAICVSRGNHDCTPLRWARLIEFDAVVYRAEVDSHQGGILLNEDWAGLAEPSSSWSRLKALYEP